MRDDLLALDVADVAWFVAALEDFERLSVRFGVRLPRTVPEVKLRLATHLSRVAGGVRATAGAGCGAVGDDVVDTASAAARLGITASAVRKRCETGMYRGVARKRHGRWWIPVEDIEVEIESGGAA